MQTSKGPRDRLQRIAPYAALAAVDGLLAFLAFYLAVKIGLGVPVNELIRGELHVGGNLWARALLYAVLVVLWLLAVGLYRERQPPTLPGTDVILRIVAAVVMAGATQAALRYFLPGVYLWRGVAGLVVVFTGYAVLVSRTIFVDMAARDSAAPWVRPNVLLQRVVNILWRTPPS